MKDLKVFAEKLDLVAIGEQLKKFPEAYMPSEHFFADRTYTRKTSMPRGTFAIGKKHRFKVTNILLEGKISVYMGEHEPIRVIEAPAIFVSEAGVQKMAYFHSDTVWLNVHDNPTNTQDLEEIEDYVIIPEDEKELICLQEKD